MIPDPASTDQDSAIISDTGTAMFRSLTGDSDGIARVKKLIDQLEDSLSTVLILGESGTGKEVVARNLHYVSGRHDRPFVAVNCAAITPQHFAEALYGIGDEQPRLIRQAEGGTLFLDMVDELPGVVQAGLLRFLETQHFTPVGGHESCQADVRIIAATHSQIEEKVKAGDFRRDLYYRLNVIPLEVPPLRARSEDIPALIRELLIRLGHQGRTPVTFNAVALKSLQCHDWPGNVRELANLVERLCILHGSRVVGFSDLPAGYQYPEAEILLSGEGTGVGTENGARSIRGSAQSSGSESLPPAPSYNPRELLDDGRLRSMLSGLERDLVQVALIDCERDPALTARRLDVDESRLRKLRETYGL